MYTLHTHVHGVASVAGGRFARGVSSPTFWRPFKSAILSPCRPLRRLDSAPGCLAWGTGRGHHGLLHHGRGPLNLTIPYSGCPRCYTVFNHWKKMLRLSFHGAAFLVFDDPAPGQIDATWALVCRLWDAMHIKCLAVAFHGADVSVVQQNFVRGFFVLFLSKLKRSCATQRE